MAKPTGLNLIPWDHTSEAHVARMVAQRRVCGWAASEVEPSWIPRAEKGLKTMFWVFILGANRRITGPRAATPGSQGKVSKRDSASDRHSTISKPRAKGTKRHVLPTHRPRCDEQGSNARPGRLYGWAVTRRRHWISSLYISPMVQRHGLGRAVMSHLESLVAQAPPASTNGAHEASSSSNGLPTAALAGTTIALDTPPKEWHVGAWAKENFWDPLNLPMPKISNQEWYQQQGYSVFAELPDHRPIPLPNGGTTNVPLILLKKVVR
ncbi:hypothetical protein O1611_g2112 [Lasiodiplodia mahajangana]|uniref:Uncharacterized protein n=1 Tax=Lasiodiplodia mahajangana TaxID=1108764 RepID=A0ACC2JVG6_9PEZI|nr:hypothetical protein O1611_g2112 [Lasiodiplodia mahajangana]